MIVSALQRARVRHAVFPDTGVVSSSGLDSAREALRAKEPERLLGLAECDWLDVKGGVYVLDQPYGAEELIKDVAAFANAETGGVLVVGFSTRTEHGVEILDQIRPVPRELVDLDRYRKLLRRIIPLPRGVTVGWIDAARTRGSSSSTCPRSRLRGCRMWYPARDWVGKPGRLPIAVPVREGDSTHWLPRPRPAAPDWPPDGQRPAAPAKRSCAG